MPTATLSAIKRMPRLGKDIAPDPRAVSVAVAATKGAPDYVEDEKSYRVVIQLGADTSWRKYKGGRWCIDEENSPPHREGIPQKHAVLHVPRIHECEEIYSGKVVNGLISNHAQYLDAVANPEMEREGEHGYEKYTNPRATIGRQLLVLEIEEVDQPCDNDPALRERQEKQKLYSVLDRIAVALENE